MKLRNERAPPRVRALAPGSRVSCLCEVIFATSTSRVKRRELVSCRGNDWIWARIGGQRRGVASNKKQAGAFTKCIGNRRQNVTVGPHHKATAMFDRGGKQKSRPKAVIDRIISNTEQPCPQMTTRLGHHADLALHIHAPIRSPDKPSHLTRTLL